MNSWLHFMFHEPCGEPPLAETLPSSSNSMVKWGLFTCSTLYTPAIAVLENAKTLELTLNPSEICMQLKEFLKQFMGRAPLRPAQSTPSQPSPNLQS